MSNCFPAGIDIGSTTVKLVILGKDGEILFGQYRRHRAHTQQTLAELLREARTQLGPCRLQVKITGSGSLNLGKAMDIAFVQEVVAVASSLERVAPQTDVAIELGGEDAKIIYFRIRGESSQKVLIHEWSPSISYKVWAEDHQTYSSYKSSEEKFHRLPARCNK